MSNALKTYSSNEVVVTIAGILLNDGRADGDFLSIERNAPSFTKKTGADGEVTRSKNNDRSATATVTLMQTATANALLSALNLLDVNSEGGAGVGPFIVKDLQGATLYFAEQAWIARAPNPTFGAEANTREWLIDVANLIGGEGGN